MKGFAFLEMAKRLVQKSRKEYTNRTKKMKNTKKGKRLYKGIKKRKRKKEMCSEEEAGGGRRMVNAAPRESEHVKRV